MEEIAINYLTLRDELLNTLKASSFVSNISIINTWNLYGLLTLKYESRNIKQPFKVELKEDTILYYLHKEYLGEIKITNASIFEGEKIVKEILKALINFFRKNQKEIVRANREANPKFVYRKKQQKKRIL